MNPSKRSIAVGVAALAVLAIAVGLYVNRTENVDVVKGVPPVSTGMRSIAGTLEHMTRLPEGERGAYLERTWPHLSNDVVFYLRRIGKIKPEQQVARVELKYGSLEKIAAESAGGTKRYGHFNNQMVAIVRLAGEVEPIPVLVECLNGTFIALDQLRTLQSVGDHTPIEVFTIAKGKGLIHYVDFPVAIDLAARFDLPLFKGKKIAQANRITPEQARLLEAKVDEQQVTVRVIPGDKFDLRTMTFTPSPMRKRT